ncbi:lysophospholipid acyltransferase family protein [Plesiocystis pacifica]|uniref:lysophospholipid acyltransferase family protein n=1 Tax=Plesiocystis pacifica TaxID=191768 RepID=UPI0012F95E60|nr:lysophospholipid acyltransferase family protein [Plesiocystis pacifica]
MASLTRDDYIRKGVWKILWSLAVVFVIPWTRTKVRNWGRVPRRGGLLIVANHPSPWDPIAVPWASIRQVHNLGTDQLLRVPYFGWMMPYFSMIPFKKGMRDPEALKELKRRVDNGDAALIFAEGDRTWTGRSNPLKPGIGRMVKRLGVPVATVCVETGHMKWPRWAKYPRAVPLQLRVIDVTDYPEDMSPEAITADLATKISVDPEAIELPPRSFGFRLAHGLPSLLWACPHCFAVGALHVAKDDDDCIECGACSARWRVTLRCQIVGEGGGAEDMFIDKAASRLHEHFGELPIADRESFENDGIALVSEAMVERIHRGKVEAEALGVGLLELRHDRLRFTDERGLEHELEFHSVRAVLMQVGNRLQVRTDEENFQLTPTAHSTNMWKLFIDRHLHEYRSRDAS